MTLNDLLTDAFGRVREGVHEVTSGLSGAELTFRPTPRANSIAWLVWHLTRVQDDHVSELAEREQVWSGENWHGRFGLALDLRDTGFGHSPEEVGRLQVDGPDLLLGYYDAVHEQTVEFVAGLRPGDLGRIVDTRWDPPVTLGVRLVSIVNDDTQHIGQAAYLRGLLPSS